MKNAFLSTIEHGPRKGKLRLRGIPGLKDFTTLPDSPLRGMLAVDGGNSLWAVAGSTLFQVFLDGTFLAATGGISLNQHPVIMEANGFVMAIASGGQLFKAIGIGSGLAAAVSNMNFQDDPDGTPGLQVPAGTMTFLDNYFIVSNPDTKQIYISSLDTTLGALGTIWDPGDTKIKEGYPDNICRVLADNQQLWIFGFDTTEVWQNTGAVFPFERIQGAVLKVGCSAPYSPAAARGYRFWVWKNVIYGAYGLDPQRISDAGVEQALRSYATTADAECWCQVFGQHVFYVASFPGAKRTWVYDLTHKAWHERGLWKNGQTGIYRGRVYAEAFGKHLVGDPETGAIRQMDEHTYTDAGGLPLRRQRTVDYITDGMSMVRYNQLTVDMDTGVGLDVASDQPGYDPQLIMRYSGDRGKTYSSDLQTSIGRIGETEARVIYNQLGSSRIGRTFDFVLTDPVPFSVNGAYLKLGKAEAGR